MMAKLLLSTIIISNSQIEILVSYSMSTNVNVNMCFPNSKFEGNFSTYVFGKSLWHYLRAENLMLDIATPIMRKNIKVFLMCGRKNSCRKVKYIRSVNFNDIIITNMQFGNDFFLFIYPVTFTNIQGLRMSM